MGRKRQVIHLFALPHKGKRAHRRGSQGGKVRWHKQRARPQAFLNTRTAGFYPIAQEQQRLVFAQQDSTVEAGRLATWVWQFGAGVAGGLVFLAVLVPVARLLKISEFFGLLNPILRRLRLPTFG